MKLLNFRVRDETKPPFGVFIIDSVVPFVSFQRRFGCDYPELSEERAHWTPILGSADLAP